MPSVCVLLRPVHYLTIYKLVLFYSFFFLQYSFLPIPGHGETVIFDIVKNEWSVAITSPPSSISTNKVWLSFICCHILASLFSTFISFII